MANISREYFPDWSGGVQNSADGDAIPPNAYQRGQNVALTLIGEGRAAVKKRDGMTCLNTTPVTGSTAVIGIYEFRKLVGASFTRYILVVSDNGRLDTIDPDGGTLSTVSATAFTSETDQSLIPSFATANNRCYIVNGTDAKLYDGTNLYGIGIVAPSTAPTLADSGVAGLPNGTYESRVTFYDSVSGQESSAGPTSSTQAVASKKISFTAIPVSTNPRVDTRRVYIRNTGTQANFYLAGTLSDNTTTILTYNLADTSLVTIGPDTSENNPPVAGVKFACYHKSRLFLADTTTLYYSKLDSAESFDPFATEEPNPSDGQSITGLISIFDLLIIFKSKSAYVLVGDDPDSWSIRPIDNTIGCATARSIIPTQGKLYWWSVQGPVEWDGGLSPPILMGPKYIQTTISPDNLSVDSTALAKVAGSYDAINLRLVWSVPQTSQSRNTLILPYSLQVERWESDGWDPMDACSLASITNANGRPYIILGNYAGQLFHMGDAATNDGVVTGTTTGTFVASGTSTSTITDLTATFDTTGGGLVERKVTIVDSSNNLTDNATVRPHVSSNTATMLTLDHSVTGLVNGATYTYYIGGPAMDFETAWLNQGDTFTKKRYMFVYLHMRATGGLTNLHFHFYRDYNSSPDVSLVQTVTSSINTNLWDVAVWDVGVWGGTADLTTRYRIGRTGLAFMLRIRHFPADAPLTLLKVGTIVEALSEKIG